MELLDRNYYRTCDDSKLFEEAKYNPTAELAIILAERLDDVLLEADTDIAEAKERAADFERDALELDDKIYMLQSEIARNEETIASMAAEIAYLKEQQND